MKSFEDLIKKITEFYGDFKLQEKLSSELTEGTAGGGLVKVGVNQLSEIIYVNIDDSIFNKHDKVLVERLIVEAVNSALTKVKSNLAQKMQEIAKKILELEKEK